MCISHTNPSTGKVTDASDTNLATLGQENSNLKAENAELRARNRTLETDLGLARCAADDLRCQLNAMRGKHL